MPQQSRLRKLKACISGARPEAGLLELILKLTDMKSLIIILMGPFMLIGTLYSIHTIISNMDIGKPIPCLAWGILIIVSIWLVKMATIPEKDYKKIDRLFKKLTRATAPKFL